MAKHFRDLTEGFGSERLARIDREAQVLFLEYELISQLRKDQQLTQQELAELLDIRQHAISRLEHQEDVLVSTLERYIKALGGELEIRAKFPDRVVTINQFSERLTPTHPNP